jgi:hypothetical protein
LDALLTLRSLDALCTLCTDCTCEVDRPGDVGSAASSLLNCAGESRARVAGHDQIHVVACIVVGDELLTSTIGKT